MINATGPFADSVRRMSDPAATPMIMASAGVHVTLPDYYSPEQHLGMIVPKTKDGRVVFMLPWLEATIAGTTGARALGYTPLQCSCPVLMPCLSFTWKVQGQGFGCRCWGASRRRSRTHCLHVT